MLAASPALKQAARLRQWLAKWFSRRDDWPAPIDGSHVLAKASCDYWEYFVGLKSGLIVRCSEVAHRGDWLTLKGIQRVELANGETPMLGEMYVGRGMEVRVSEVAWCVDQDS